MKRQLRAKASRRSRSPTYAPTSTPTVSRPTRVRTKASKRSRRPRATPSSIPTVSPSADPSNSAFKYHWNETAKLIASDGDESDLFGRSVSVSGNIAIVGAYEHDENGENSGAVYVFEKDDSTGYWNETAKLTASDGDVDDTFGRSISISGNIAIVGANQNDDNGTYSGSVYVYERDGNTGYWNETAKLTASDAEAYDEFGIGVSISGNIVIISAYDDDNGDYSGSVYVFEKDELTGSWQETAKLVASDGAEYDSFGRSVSLSGTTAIVGAYLDDDKGTSSGSAYVFEKDDSTGDWKEISKLTASDGQQYDNFGHSVSVSGNTAIVGAFQDDDNGDNSGSAYVYEKDDFTGSWIETSKLSASDGALDDEFGFSVSVSGNVAIIGSYYDDSNNGYGSTYVYVRDDSSGGWNETAIIIASDGAEFDNFGRSVFISGNTVIVGADRDDYNGSQSGSAYIFEASS